jgi:hypothetical protein
MESLILAPECCQSTIDTSSQTGKNEMDCVCVIRAKSEMKVKSDQLIDTLRNENEFIKSNLQKLRNELVCPITQELFSEPVMAGDGHTYERTAIENWFQIKKTSPHTNLVLTNKNLQTNWLICSLLAKFDFFQKQMSFKNNTHEVLGEKKSEELVS